MITRGLLGLGTLAMRAGWGDDLESRQASVQEQQPMGGEMTVGAQEPQASREPSAEATAQGFDDEDGGEDVVFDTMPDTLMDNAQGFGTDPIDDTSGFDPTPSDSGGFAPEPMAPESFED